MKTLQIYDPAMCCSTGVCGPSVDPRLVQLAADVAFLKSQGVRVERFNLAHQPEAFTAAPLVLAEMGPEAEHLPIFLADGELVSKATYPDRAALAGWCGIPFDPASSKPRTELKMACCDESEKCC